jgi:hypothetical protein
MTVSPSLHRRGDLARCVAVAGAVAVFILIERWLDQGSVSTLYVGFADGALSLLTSLPWLGLTSPFGQAMPVFLGLFLSLWLLLPITPGLPLRQVLLRSGVAAAVALAGGLLVGVVAWGFGPAGWFAEYPVEIVMTRDQFDGSFLNPWQRLRETVSRLLDVLPAAMLGGVLLWAWERRAPTPGAV